MKAPRRTGIAMAALAAAIVGGAASYAASQAASGSGPSAPASEAATGVINNRGAGVTMADNPDMGMGHFTENQPFDAQFLDQMAVHHEGAIMSTRAMIADSVRPELRALAEDILTSQRDQLAQMRTWRRQWYPDVGPTFGMGRSMMGGTMVDDPADGDSMMRGGRMSGPMMSDTANGDLMMSDQAMRSMMGGNAGMERMYLLMMIAHHQLAVDMAKQAQRDATHEELKDLAAVIAAERAAQITQMRDLAASNSAGG